MSTPKKIDKARRARVIAEQREYISRKTDNGAEIVDFMIALARDPDAETKERRAAYEWLQDHGIGKAADRTEVDVTIDDGSTPTVDLSNLSFDELIEYERLMSKLVGPAALPAPAEHVELIEAEIVGDGEAQG